MPSKHITTYRHENASTFVPAEKAPQPPATLPALQVPELPPAHLSGHARQDDSAVSHAHATLLVAAAYIFASAMITAGLLLIAWIYRGLGEKIALYFFSGILIWGLCILLALFANRRQGLHHSPTGVAHEEIASRERLAMHAINTHAWLLLKRWERD